MRIGEALHWGRQILASKIDNATWDTDVMLAHILQLDRIQLYLEREKALTADQENKFKELVYRRANHEPLQYILKNQQFMGLDFYVDNRVLIPRADTEILVELFLKECKDWQLNNNKTPRVLDLCTGSGALAISIAHYWPIASVVATDISPDALEVAKYNARQLNVKVEWRLGDFLEPVRGETWDFVVTNPPYIAKDEYTGLAPEIFKEPKLALVAEDNGLEYYKRLAQEAKELLNPGGIIFLEIGYLQGQAVETLFREKGFDTKVFCDYGGRDRVVIVR